MKVLALDTATRACCVAVVDNGVVVGETLLNGHGNHSENLLAAIDALCGQTDTALCDIDLIGVSAGPGSFTGLRVGISTAQGLAFALGKPLRGIASLKILAAQAGCTQGAICPMIDARKHQVYTGLYSCSPGGSPEEVVGATVIDPAVWLERLCGPVLLLGDGARRYRHAIESSLQSGCAFAPPCADIPRAAVLGQLACHDYEQDGIDQLETLVPLYVRPPDAAAPSPAQGGSHLPVV